METKTAPPISEVAAASKRQLHEEATEIASAVEAAQDPQAMKQPTVEQVPQVGIVEAQHAARLYHDTVENFDEAPQQKASDFIPQSEEITTVQPVVEQNTPQNILEIKTEVLDGTVGLEEVSYTEIDLPLAIPPAPANYEVVISPTDAAETDGVLAEEAQSTAGEAWEAALSKEPMELYEAFMSALELFSESTTATTGGEEELVEPKQPTFRIVATITERLAELNVEEKEPVALAMQDVIGALHGLQVLETRHADPEAIAAVEEQLTELCTVLFKQLEVDYTEQDIKDFVAVLRNPNFMPEARVENGANVKDHGTHEMKYFARMTGAVADIEDSVMSALGTFALNGLGLGGTREIV